MSELSSDCVGTSLTVRLSRATVDSILAHEEPDFGPWREVWAAVDAAYGIASLGPDVVITPRDILKAVGE